MTASFAPLLKRLTQGVYVVGVGHGPTVNAFTAVWVMQVSFDPILLALSINPQHTSYDLLKRHGSFSVNVLGKDQLDLAAHFGQSATAGKMTAAKWTPGSTGTPLLDEAIGWIECKVVSEHQAGDHVLVIGSVVDGKLLDAAGEPLTYRDTGDLDGASGLTR